MITRTHMTSEKDLELYMTDPIDQTGRAFKAEGFWYAIGNAWWDWCSSEMPDWVTPFIYTFSVKQDSNILVLDTPEKVHWFANKYKDDTQNLPISFERPILFMNWKDVNRDYDGVEFNPYFPQLRLDYDLLWYNGIDVPSGVIFNVDIIRNLKRHETKSFF